MKKRLYTMALALAGAVALPSCDDYLEVDSPSSFFDDFVFSNVDQMQYALNTAYAYLLSGDTYGTAYLQTYCLNSDVEFATTSSETPNTNGSDYRYFDATPDGTAINKTWTAAYQNIEYANNFIESAAASPLFEEYERKNDTTSAKNIHQMIGEAKCIRAMNYLDLVVLFGDVPFSFSRTVDNYDNLVMPIVDRNDILTAIINDLREAAPKMKFASESGVTVERCSKEYAWALIARIALTRAGYSLRPEGAAGYSMQRPDDYMEYYKIAMTYADSVISSGTHDLNLSYRQVFVNECNYSVVNNDDPIFEIPFTTGSTGSVGYIHGPKVSGDENTVNVMYGGSDGGLQLNAFYRWTFDPSDLRRDFVVGLWDYTNSYLDIKTNSTKTAAGSPSINVVGLSHRCNKWSKLWNANGSYGESSKGSTGINFPYMRYADVLLMYAEASNEVNGAPTAEGIAALNKVRQRAGLADLAPASHDDMFKAIMAERAWEFGGENIRWKDLVRWNKYSEVVYRQFWNYYCFADYLGSTSESEETINRNCTYYAAWAYSSKEDSVGAPDPAGLAYSDIKSIYNGLDVISNFNSIYYTPRKANPQSIDIYPCVNSTYYVMDIINAYGTPRYFSKDVDVDATAYTRFTGGSSGVNNSWVDGDNEVRQGARLSFRGYIMINNVGNLTSSRGTAPARDADINSLPAVRYILPIPRTFVARSKGAYENHYGYN